ncbi:sigma-70 family RNA polymerase sigma factor [uncultured Psychrosphaera sp.]|uniref:RNA polymerase sigma factor n=1 Tax=uncultured Psychrosphaera sp. TaxID=1403522 RepID=UPI0030FC4F64
MDQWDEDIALRMKAGDQAAFKICYQVLSPVLYHLLLKISKNEELAKDLLQDTFIDAFQNMKGYKIGSNFKSWIKRIAFNNFYNAVKRKDYINQNDIEVEDCIQDSPIHESALADTQLFELLLSILNESERLIIWLYIVEQYSHQEIATLFGKTSSFSKSTVSRSLMRIKSHVKVKNYAY